ncbi:MULTISPECIES: WG repeat-containing protein [unclassified Acinetobacter]|uniref:WG repeat-containing protein n=1 Tax=unclassified Acinetobacter TaxID=196816 RepID=UPI0035B82480
MPLEYDDVSSFREGLAIVTKDNQKGYINQQGKIVVPIKYHSADLFNGGVAVVGLDDKLYQIDKSGKIVGRIE